MAGAGGGQFVLMALPGPYAPVLPEFDRFLFASVGEEIDGIPLSVLSALARLGLDPRGEATRLSHLAGGAAADQLARTIARLPGERWTASEMRRIAGGLIELLPRVTPGVSIGVGAGSAKTSIRASPWLIVLALAGAVLIGLVAHGSLSFGGPRQTSQPVFETLHPGSAR
jgi:hypothetical protein